MSMTSLLDAADVAVDDEHTPVRRRRYNNGDFGRPVRLRSTSVLGWAGDILATFGVIIVLFVVWMLGWSNFESSRAQSEAAQNMEQRWASSDPVKDNSLDSAATPGDMRALTSGEAFAYIHIPAFGADWKRAVVEGVDHNSLAIGPGHYPGSQLPGQRGNTAFAGHRDGQGAPFSEIDSLDTCAPVVVETRDRWLVYRVLPTSATSSDDYVSRASQCVGSSVSSRLGSMQYSGLRGKEIISPSQTSVVAPVPGHDDIAPKDAQMPILTLTSCHPMYSNAQRIVIHAVLSQETLKSEQPDGWTPPALNGAPSEVSG